MTAANCPPRQKENSDGLRHMIEIAALSKTFGTGATAFTALKDINVTIRENEFFTLLGPSGCGKTTLLRAIAGFVDPTSGSLTINGNDILSKPPFARPVNTVFQNYALFPHMNVFESVAYSLNIKKLDKAFIKQRVIKVFKAGRLEGWRAIARAVTQSLST